VFFDVHHQRSEAAARAVLQEASDGVVQAFFLVWKELYQVNLSNKAMVDERFLL
jgi:hypothetical protein